MSKTLAAAGALLASALAVSSAVKAQDVNSMRVSYADLNLASKAGQGTLEHRIVKAARIVCVYGNEDSKELALAAGTTSCRAGAIADARPAYDAAVAAARRGTVTVTTAAALIVHNRGQ